MANVSPYLESRKDLVDQIVKYDLFGRNIYILGSAEFGASNQPTLCKSTAGVKRKFGKQGTLIDAFHKIKYTSKNNNIYLVKVTGEQSRNYLNVNIENEGIAHQGFIIESVESNEVFNDIKINIDMEYIEICLPKYFNYRKYRYNYSDYPYMDKLATAINNDVGNKVQVFYTVNPMLKTATAFYPCNPEYIYLTGGMCGLNYTKDMLYNYLERTYTYLESLDIDIIIPVDAFMDDVYPQDMNSDEVLYGKKYYQSYKDYLTQNTFGNRLSYMNQLINFCIKQLNFGVVTHGIMGYNSMAKEYSDIYNDSNDLAKMWIECFKYNYSLCDNPFYSFLISVVAGDILYNKSYPDNGYLAYAALCAKTMITEGTTNLKISDTISLYHELEAEYLEQLVDCGIVTFRHSVLFEQPVVYDGITAFQDNKDFGDAFKNFANVRMIQIAVAHLNKVFQYYIGCNIDEVIKAGVINADIKRILDTLKQKGLLTNYSFAVVPYYNQNQIKVYLNLESIYMIKPVTICPILDIQYDESGVLV